MDNIEKREHYTDLFRSDGWGLFRADIIEKMQSMTKHLMALSTEDPHFTTKAARLIDGYQVLKANITVMEERKKAERKKANQGDSS